MDKRQFVIKEENAMSALDHFIDKNGAVCGKPEDIIEYLQAHANFDQPGQVAKFLDLFGFELPKVPIEVKDIPLDRIQLAANLILEETFEIFECLGAQGVTSFMCSLQKLYDNCLEKFDKQGTTPFPIKSKAELLKELTDLGVVQHNLTAFCGMQDYYDEAFDETMESNFSKGYASTMSAEDDLEEIINVHGKDYATIVKPNPKEEWYIIRRKIDNKILKGSTYNPANIQKILDR